MQNFLGVIRVWEYNKHYSMEELYTTKLRKVGDSQGIIVPVPILNGLNWKRGDRVLYTFGLNDTLIVKKIDDEIIRQIKREGGLGDEPTIQI